MLPDDRAAGQEERGENMGSEEEKKGFTIRDRRASSPGAEAAKTEGPAGEEGQEPRGKAEPPSPEEASLPEIDFSSFVFSLSTSALLHLGEVPDPATRQFEKNLPLAKQTIDILGMLEEKTRGNLTADEAKLLENLLADLRWRYVREAKA
jgi:hypothetical protein